MKYLIAIHRPNDFDPQVSGDESMARDIDLLNEEMEAKGVRLIAAGLQPLHGAKSLRMQSSGEVVIADGPYLPSDEYVDGFWILECADLSEALDWGRRAVVACRASVEVRALYAGS